MRNKKVRIEKVINNNIISARDDKGVELVVMGRGIGFDKKPGNEITDGKIEKIFRLDKMDDREHFKELLASLPLEYIRLSTDIITYAKDSLELKLNQNVYLTLTDHIGFALNRHREGMDFNNVLYDEIRLFYPVEYSIGRYALELIEERTGYRLAEDEAASIALHIINGELDSAMGTTFFMIKMMREMMGIIEKNISIPEGRNYPKDRLISDLKQLANRLVSEKLISGRRDEKLYLFVEDNYTEEYRIINSINDYIGKEYKCSMTEEEKIYLTLSIKRIKDIYSN
ncbi:MAG: PRD domain-containing protein [Lachnospiraceae bacterium]|nr:PRD domain-containing protein [Lachnospiraceae bacterium]